MAPFTFDVSDHWKYFHFTQTISYYPRLDNTNYGGAITVLALKREDHKTFETTSVMVELPNHDAIWNIWTDTMSTAFIPKRGDKFVATNVSGSITWIVNMVDYCTPTFVTGTSTPTRYRLHCATEKDAS